MSAAHPISDASHKAPFGMEAPDSCPTCEQQIPADRVAAVRGRLAAREHQLAHELQDRLQAEFAKSRDQDRLLAQQALEAQRRDSDAALEQERNSAAARHAADLNSARTEMTAAFAKEREAEKRQADQLVSTLEERLKTAAEDRAELAREAANKSAELTAANKRALDAEAIARDKLLPEFQSREVSLTAELNDAHAKTLADLEGRHQQTLNSHQTETDQLRQSLAAATASAQQQVDAEKQRSLERETAALNRATGAEAQLVGAQNAHASLTEQLRTMKETRDADIARATQEARDALEKDKVAAVQAVEIKARDEKQKLMDTVEDMKRQLEKKSLEELGEGAELDLFEQLKEHFEDDVIRRVKKGAPGADIIHEIKENGVVCGKIVYESKNRKDFKTEYAAKLRVDQLAERAEHAVLSTNKFPPGSKQLHIVEHVILACPARVLAVAQLLRDHIVQMHTLRASNEDRDEKTQKLYDFMTSARAEQLFDAVLTQLTNLEQLDEDEQSAHTRVWGKRHKMLKAIEKAQGNMRFEVQKIVGVADESDNEDEE